MAGSIRDLWQLISGKAVLLPDEIISTELNENKTKLQLCLNYFKPLSTPAKVDNIGRKCISKVHSNFVLKLAEYLDLYEAQSYDIYQLYLLKFSKKCVSDIQEVLSMERCSMLLAEKIQEFYQSERIYLLRCVKHVLSYCDDPDHPHYEVFKDFASNLLEGNNFIEEIKKQYSGICEKISSHCTVNQQELRGFVVPMSMVRTEKSKQGGGHLRSLQRERCELLEIILLCFKHLELSPETLHDLFVIFKKHGFAGNVGQRSEENDQSLLDRICFLQILVLVGGLDLELLVEKFSDPSPDCSLDLMVMKDDHYKLFNDSIGCLGDQPCLGPLFLAWAVVRHLRKDSGFAKLGNRALKLDVFEYLHDMLSEIALNGIDQSIEGLVHNILYGLTNSVLSIFHESTLGDTRFLYKTTNRVLENPLTADAFWSLNMDEGLRSLLATSLVSFPLQFERPMEMFTSLAKCGESSLRQVIHLLQNMTILTDILDRQTVLTPTNEESLYRLAIARKPALYPGSRITIYENTLGKILNDPILDGSKVSGDFVSWFVPYDAFDVLLGEVSNLLQNFESCSSDQVGPMKRATLVMGFIGEALRTSPGLVREKLSSILDGFVDGAMRVLQKFSSATNPPIHLLGSCFQVLRHSMDLLPQEVWRGIQMSGFMPHFSYHVKDLNDAIRALNSGSYGQILMSREIVEGSYPVTEAFLEFVLHCINFSAVPESTAAMTAPVLFICQEIFTTYNKWKYSDAFSSERIGLLCMKIFEKVLSSREDEEEEGQGVKQKKGSTPKKRKGSHETADMLKLSPDMAVLNCMLFSETGNTLLAIAHTGSDQIEIKIAEQSSACGGRGSSLVELVKGSLCVLNRLLTEHPSAASNSQSLGRALSTTPGTAGPESLQAKQTRSPPHLVKSLVMYVEQRHDCSLAVQATSLLKNIAQTFPISMLSCLGTDVYKVKETYLFRLQAIVDDVGLKVAILDWLTACIQSQPGLVEIFINDDENNPTASGSDSSSWLFSDLKVPEKTTEAQKSKCLDVVASLITGEKQGTYACPMELLCASLELIHSLWKEYQMSSMTYLKKLDTFWKSLFCVLDNDRLEKIQESERATDIQMNCISHVIRIFALEIYHSDRSGNYCPGFVEKMNSVVDSDGILRWSEFIKERASEEGGGRSELLLLAWRDFLVILASLKRKGTKNSIVEIGNKKDAIMLDLLDVLKVTVSSSTMVNLKISNILSSLIVILVNRWSSTLEKPRKVVESLCIALEGLLGSPVIHKCDSLLLSIVSSLVIVFKQCKSHFLSDATNNAELVRRIMDIICRLLQSSLLYREGHEFISDEEGKKKMKIFENSSKLKLLPISVIHLLTEILGAFPASSSAKDPNPGSSFSLVPSSPTTPRRGSPSPPLLVRVGPPSTTFIFDLLGHYSVVQSLVSWCTYGLVGGEDLDLVQAIFLYFIRLAQTERGAEMLSVNAVNDQLGVYVHQLYFDRNQSAALGKQVESTSDQERHRREERISTYLLFTRLTCQLLVTLKAFYLDKALDYLGIHRDRFHEVLESFVLPLFAAKGGVSKARTTGASSGRRDSGSRSPFGSSVRRSEEAGRFGANLGLYELEVVCHFVNELAKFKDDWKIRSPDLLQTIMTRVCVWTQKSAGLLLLPRFMQSAIESQRSDQSSSSSLTTKGDVTSQSKHIFTPEESSQSTLELLKVQQKILSIIAINLNTMKRFTVPLVDIIYQRLEDLPEISESFVLVDFSNPSIDENSMPTFGMLVSVFNFCVDLLYKVEGSKSLSPHKPSTPKPIAAGNLNKPLIMFTMDQVLYLMMSHASHCLKNPKVSPQEKQILKSYLNNELSSCLNAVYRHFRSGSPSPVSARRSSVGAPAPLKFNQEHRFFSLADQFTKHVLK